jgi:hypothetical protein
LGPNLTPGGSLIRRGNNFLHNLFPLDYRLFLEKEQTRDLLLFVYFLGTLPLSQFFYFDIFHYRRSGNAGAEAQRNSGRFRGWIGVACSGQIRPGIDSTKLHFGRKNVGQIFVLKFLDDYPPKNNTCIFTYLSIMDKKFGFQCISKPHETILTNLNFSNLDFVRKLRPKRFHKIGSRTLLPRKSRTASAGSSTNPRCPACKRLSINHVINQSCH